jgi:hypothetical protein
MLEEYELLNEELEKKNEELVKENEKLKEEYMILQNASDKVEEELQQRIDKAIEYIENETTYSDYKEMDTLINILRGDKE